MDIYTCYIYRVAVVINKNQLTQGRIRAKLSGAQRVQKIEEREEGERESKIKKGLN